MSEYYTIRTSLMANLCNILNLKKLFLIKYSRLGIFYNIKGFLDEHIILFPLDCLLSLSETTRT